MSELDSSLETFGRLLFFRKNEDSKGTSYPLCAGETIIGSSDEADIRLKLTDERLQEIHCIIDVEDNGRATVINKSEQAPVTVDGIQVEESKVLFHGDLLNLLGKRFQYLTDQKNDENPPKLPKFSKKSDVASNRHTVIHPVHTKSPEVRTKTSMLLQKKPIRRKTLENSGSEFTNTKTPPRRTNATEKNKTTSKIIGSKALRSPLKLPRRFSLGNRTPKQQTPKISSRNIILRKSIISSAIKAESEKTKNKIVPAITPKNIVSKTLEKSISSKKVKVTPKNIDVSVKVEKKGATPKTKVSLVKPVFKQSAKKSLKLEPKAITNIKKQYSLDLINFSPPRKSAIKSSFRRDGAKLDSGELSKVVNISSIGDDARKTRKSVSFVAEPRRTSNRSVNLRLSSTNMSISPLELSGHTTYSSELEQSETQLNGTDNKKNTIHNGSKFTFEQQNSVSENISFSSDANAKMTTNETSRSLRRMSKDNPKYYSSDLITEPRCTTGAEKTPRLSVGTPSQKSKTSLATSTPMPLLEKSKRSIKKSLDLEAITENKSYNRLQEADLIFLTPEEQKRRSSYAELIESDDLLARLSPIKSPVRRSLSHRLSRSVLEKSFSETSDNDDDTSRGKSENFNRKSQSLYSNKDLSKSQLKLRNSSKLKNKTNNSVNEKSSQENQKNQMNINNSSISQAKPARQSLRQNTINRSSQKSLNKQMSLSESPETQDSRSDNEDSMTQQNDSGTSSSAAKSRMSRLSSSSKKTAQISNSLNQPASIESLQVTDLTRSFQKSRSLSVGKSEIWNRSELQAETSQSQGINISTPRKSTRISVPGESILDQSNKSSTRSENTKGNSHTDNSLRQTINTSLSRKSENKSSALNKSLESFNPNFDYLSRTSLSKSLRKSQSGTSLSLGINTSKSRHSMRLGLMNESLKLDKSLSTGNLNQRISDARDSKNVEANDTVKTTDVNIDTSTSNILSDSQYEMSLNDCNLSKTRQSTRFSVLNKTAQNISVESDHINKSLNRSKFDEERPDTFDVESSRHNLNAVKARKSIEMDTKDGENNFSHQNNSNTINKSSKLRKSMKTVPVNIENVSQSNIETSLSNRMNSRQSTNISKMVTTRNSMSTELFLLDTVATEFNANGSLSQSRNLNRTQQGRSSLKLRNSKSKVTEEKENSKLTENEVSEYIISTRSRSSNRNSELMTGGLRQSINKTPKESKSIHIEKNVSEDNLEKANNSFKADQKLVRISTSNSAARDSGRVSSALSDSNSFLTQSRKSFRTQQGKSSIVSLNSSMESLSDFKQSIDSDELKSPRNLFKLRKSKSTVTDETFRDRSQSNQNEVNEHLNISARSRRSNRNSELMTGDLRQSINKAPIENTSIHNEKNVSEDNLEKINTSFKADQNSVRFSISNSPAIDSGEVSASFESKSNSFLSQSRKSNRVQQRKSSIVSLNISMESRSDFKPSIHFDELKSPRNSLKLRKSKSAVTEETFQDNSQSTENEVHENFNSSARSRSNRNSELITGDLRQSINKTPTGAVNREKNVSVDSFEKENSSFKADRNSVRISTRNSAPGDSGRVSTLESNSNSFLSQSRKSNKTQQGKSSIVSLNSSLESLSDFKESIPSDELKLSRNSFKVRKSKATVPEETFTDNSQSTENDVDEHLNISAKSRRSNRNSELMTGGLRQSLSTLESNSTSFLSQSRKSIRIQQGKSSIVSLNSSMETHSDFKQSINSEELKSPENSLKLRKSKSTVTEETLQDNSQSSEKEVNVHLNISVRSRRSTRKSELMTGELTQSIKKTSTGNRSIHSDKSISEDNLEKANNPFKADRKSVRTSIKNSSVSDSVRVSTSLESLPFVNVQSVAIGNRLRAMSLDNGLNENSSPIPTNNIRRSLGVNVLQNLPYSNSTLTDSDNSAIPRKTKSKLIVAKHLESIQNSSYKESFDNSIVSSKTSTPRKSIGRESKSTLSEFLNNESYRNMSSRKTSDEIIILNSSADTDSLKENRSTFLTTPTPGKYSRKNVTKVSQLGDSENDFEKSSISVKSNATNKSKLSESFDNISVDINNESSLFQDSTSHSTRTPTPRLSRRSSSSRFSKTMAQQSNKNRSIDANHLSDSPYTPTCTPTNNISVVYVDTTFEKSSRSSKLSKTLNITMEDDLELTTPKSALKGNRSKSLPYRPITEDISPASPVKTGRDDNSFKTPFNTPGLFENIRESVLKSRSRLQKSTSTLSAQLTEVFAEEKSLKRRRETVGGSTNKNKRRKIEEQLRPQSFGSFHSEEIIQELSQLDSTATLPPNFENLTNKPVIIEPKTNTRARSYKHKNQKSPKNDLSDVAGLKQLLRTPKEQNDPTNDLINIPSFKKIMTTPKQVKSPKNDLTNVAGVKKLLKTPKTMKSPRNDLRTIVGIRKLMATPKQVKSPKNDLTNVAGVKKLMSTPKQRKSPKNDLRKVIGVKKLMTTPKQNKSPKNDLSNVAGVKKLMSTPKQAKSPKNDLRKIIGVKKLMATPKLHKSPKNDLTNVAGVRKIMTTPREVRSPKNDLTDVTGVRKLMSTPKEMKSPRNDLTDVTGVKRLMTIPKEMKAPRNDLSDIEGIANLFAHRKSNISDQDNNGDMFAKVFYKLPLKTYRGQSISPFKQADTKDTAKTTLGDVQISPRVENWVKEQAELKHLENVLVSSKKTRKLKDSTNQTETVSEVDTTNKALCHEATKQNQAVSSPIEVSTRSRRNKITKIVVSTPETSRTRRQKQTIPQTPSEDQIGIPTEDDKSLKRKDKKKKINSVSDIEEKQNTPMLPEQKTRGGRKKIIETPVEVPESTPVNTPVEEITDQVKSLRRGRGKVADNMEKIGDKVEPPTENDFQSNKRGRGKKGIIVHDKEKKDTDVEERTLKVTRRRNGQKNIQDETIQSDIAPKVDNVHENKTTKQGKQDEVVEEQVKISRRDRGRIMEKETDETPEISDNTPKNTRNKKKGHLLKEGDNDENSSSPAIVEKSTRKTKTKLGTAVLNVENDEAPSLAPQNKTRGKKQLEVESKVVENVNETDSMKSIPRRGNRNVSKENVEIKLAPEEIQTVEATSKTRTRGRKNVNVTKDVISDMEPILSSRKRGNKQEIVEKEGSLSQSTKRGKKVAEKTFEDISTDAELEKNIVESAASVQKKSRRRNVESEEVTEDSATDHSKENNKKRVVFAEPLFEVAKIRGRNTKIVKEEQAKEEIGENITTRRSRRGKTKADMEVSKEKETVEAPSTKRTRRGVLNEHEETKGIVENSERRSRRR